MPSFTHRPPRPAPTHATAPPAPAEFDAFYLGARRRVLLQCFALTGDLTAARAGVRDAFVAAHHHWRKVSRLEHPEDWLRPRAWSTSQRRSAARIRHREKGLDDQQSAVLDALAKLPDLQRKTILLTHLASVSLPGIGRELGQTQPVIEHHLQQATTTLALALDCDSALIRGQIAALAPLVTHPGLPRVAVIRRHGQRRRRWHAVGGSALAVAVTVGAGWFVLPGHQLTRLEIDAHPITAAMLLSPAQVQPVAPGLRWAVTETGNNTRGSGINSICQRSRFADDQGLGTWVRKLQTTSGPLHDIVQTVEVSASPGATMKTYDTTLGWYAGCTEARVQLVQAYHVSGVGEQAQALELQVPGKKARTYTVVVARSGSVTTTTVLGTKDPTKSPATVATAQVAPLVNAASTALDRMCGTTAVGHCAPMTTVTPTVSPTLPPASGEVRGMLATADLPAVASIDLPWVGTNPVIGGPNLAATTCDAADFTRAGVARPRSRTFLIPQAKLPQRFGLTETSGTFSSTASARSFVATIRHRMATCAKRELGSRLSHHLDQRGGPTGATYSMWRLVAEINRKQKVSYWMGIAQVGRQVAQVTFTPSGNDDIGAQAFQALVERARDRLYELGG